MTVRDLNFIDWPIIERLHAASGFDYELPDPNKEAFAAMKLVVDGTRPVGAALARMTVEIYGFCDPEWGTPAMRLEMLRLLHREISAEMAKQKIRTAHAWLPPQLAKSFGRRLKRLFHWNEPGIGWRCMVKDIF